MSEKEEEKEEEDRSERETRRREIVRSDERSLAHFFLYAVYIYCIMSAPRQHKLPTPRRRKSKRAPPSPSRGSFRGGREQDAKNVCGEAAATAAATITTAGAVNKNSLLSQHVRSNLEFSCLGISLRVSMRRERRSCP